METKKAQQSQRQKEAVWEVRRYEAAKEMMSRNVIPSAMRMLEDGYSPFGDDGNYEIMTFGGGEQEVTLKSGHSYTLTVNVEEFDPSADSVGSDYENWSDF